jgi:membrane protease YdiL (CAAX protease family)
MTTITHSPASLGPATTRSYSWPRALLLNFAPGVATVALSLAVAPLARAVGLPSALGYTVAIGLVTLGEIGWLRRAARLETGTPSLLGAVSLRRKLGWRRTALWTLAFVAVTVVLNAVLTPVSGAIDGAFGWLPTDLSPELTDSDVATFGKVVVLVVLLVNWLLDAVVNAPVEELYWKGHLMTRLPVAGMVAPVAMGLLFASEHFWEPADFVLVALVQVGLSVLAWRTRSLGVAISTHVLVNTLVTAISAVSLLS